MVVVHKTSTIRGWWAEYRCSSRTDRTMNNPDFTMWGKGVGGVPVPAEPAFRALQMALDHTGYVPLSVWVERLCAQGGIAGKPCQANGTNCSLHNYRLAVDIDPKQNPQSSGDPFAGRFKLHHVQAVERIRNVWGEQVWTWGGRWSLPDRMHFQINVPPARTAIEWSTVGGFVMPETHQHAIDHPIGPRKWADGIWPEYVEAGGTSDPTSRSWETNREDSAWLWWRFIKPMSEDMEEMRAQLNELEDKVRALSLGAGSDPDAVRPGDILQVKIEAKQK